ncbi:hypothetical protein M3Y99_00427100 [Aphelenchoides fujianensis]|nr:hypothetical protein M3Y99_00427100 [Aphelenchoides fujianensis]
MSSKGKRGGRKAKVKQQEPAAAEGGGNPNESLAADFEMVGLDVLSWMNETVNFESTGWSRTAPSQQQMRDQNKQLRLVFPEDDPLHTQDARTAEELHQRRQVAIKIRNQQLVGSGKFLAYQFPLSIDDVANGVPLERCRPEIASVQIATNPFARGGERIAYYGRDLKTNEDVVLKEYRFMTNAVEAGLRHEIANQVQTVASYFAAHFMAACEQKMDADKIPALLDFLMIKTLALGPMNNLRYMCCEPRLDPNATHKRR